MGKVHSKTSDARLMPIAVVLACNLLFHVEQKLVSPLDFGIGYLFLSAIVFLTTADGVCGLGFGIWFTAISSKSYAATALRAAPDRAQVKSARQIVPDDEHIFLHRLRFSPVYRSRHRLPGTFPRCPRDSICRQSCPPFFAAYPHRYRPDAPDKRFRR